MREAPRVLYPIEHGELSLIGEPPRHVPYLRVTHAGNEYIGALEGRRLLSLAQSIARVMGYRLVKRNGAKR